MFPYKLWVYKMNKTKMTISIVLILLFTILTGCTIKKDLPAKNDTHSNKEPIINTVSESDNTITKENEAETATGFIISEEINVFDFNELPDDIKGTIIPIDSLLLYHAETGNEYDSNNSYMLWRTLQYAFGNFGINYNRAQTKDYNITVEPMTIGEFTTSIIDGDYRNYPIPAELSDDIWYDGNDDLYYFGLGDRGLSQTEILKYQYLEDHNLKVTARLYGLDDNTTICSGTFYLKRNDYASGVIEPLFYYTVTDVEYLK